MALLLSAYSWWGSRLEGQGDIWGSPVMLLIGRRWGSRPSVVSASSAFVGNRGSLLISLQDLIYAWRIIHVVPGVWSRWRTQCVCRCPPPLPGGPQGGRLTTARYNHLWSTCTGPGRRRHVPVNQLVSPKQQSKKHLASRLVHAQWRDIASILN